MRKARKKKGIKEGTRGTGREGRRKR